MIPLDVDSRQKVSSRHLFRRVIRWILIALMNDSFRADGDASTACKVLTAITILCVDGAGVGVSLTVGPTATTEGVLSEKLFLWFAFSKKLRICVLIQSDDHHRM